ncbi:Protein of unknown function [Flavobacteriaceae bacterium MAR_2010_188]|nr:Protein of unknown function [Flavobacteriaceae bacterium MAR_2010_188]
MKKTKSILVAVFAMLIVTATGFAQNFKDLDVSPMDATAYPTSNQVAEKKIKVYYSRPQLKGRSLTELTPSDKVWRTGANESTQITFYEDMMMGGTKIAAGTYSLFTIPGDKEWTIILSSDKNAWGSYSYDEKNDVARTTVPVTNGDKSLEAFSIAFDDEGTMHMGWDTKRVAVPFTK